MTWNILQLDKRGSLNLPAETKRVYNLQPLGTSLAVLDINGVIIVVPLVGDAHQVYAAHGEAGLRQWVTQQAGLPLQTPTVTYTPVKKTAAEVKIEVQERRLRLAHELRMQHLAAQTQVLQLRRDTAHDRAVALVEAKAERNRQRYVPPPPSQVVTPEQLEKFQKDQAAMLAGSELPQAPIDG